jgi:hypothetical protein
MCCASALVCPWLASGSVPPQDSIRVARGVHYFNNWYVASMDIDLTGFSALQQRALFNLLILAMYADGHLTTFEDA